jgi:hypothetical protein
VDRRAARSLCGGVRKLPYYKEPQGWRNSIINWVKNIIPDVIKDPEGRDVEVSRTSIRNVISHGKGPLKILTLPNLPEMLRQGILYYSENKSDKQGRQENFYNYAYPIRFEEKDWVVSITIKEDYNGKRFYDNEFVQEIKSTDGLPSGAGPSTRGNLTHPSTLNILRNIYSVNTPNCLIIFLVEMGRLPNNKNLAEIKPQEPDHPPDRRFF